jgi:hypothetical protein
LRDAFVQFFEKFIARFLVLSLQPDKEITHREKKVKHFANQQLAVVL